MDPPLQTAEIDEVMAALRDGYSLTSSGSRCHSTVSHGPEGWTREDFDQGAVQSAPIDEAAARAFALAWPQACVQLLRQRRWHAVQGAWARGDRRATLEALAAWAQWGDGLDSARILTAWLTQTPEHWDEATRAAIGRRFRDGTLYHLYMELHAWPQGDHGARAAADCLDWVDQLLRALPDPPDDVTRLRQRLLQRAAER